VDVFTKVIVIGGGMSGLAAAYELSLARVPFLLLEASNRLGGLVRTETAGDLVIDAGPDAMLAQKPAGVELCRELGIADRLVPTRPPRTAFVLRDGVLHPLPARSVLGVPTDPASLSASTLFSADARARIERERSHPAEEVDDESIASFFERRFGREAVDYLAEPLLAGIHAGDVDRLSIRALFPRLADAARRGSVTHALAADPARASESEGLFRSFPGGMQELVDAVANRLDDGSVRLGVRVASLEYEDDGCSLRLEDGAGLTAKAVIAAVPAHALADLVAATDPALAEECRAIRSTSSGAVVLAYPRDAIAHPLAGSGFVVPRAERGVRMLAATWLSSKWPGRAPDGTALLRAFFGGTRDPAATTLPDDALVELAHGDLARVLGISSEPSFARVFRWPNANTQYEVGYLRQLAGIRARIAAHRRLLVTGAGFGSIGIPDCIADGRRVARLAAAG
jgi:oxygen-dependent protoporphyrinogen oxidase